MKRLDLTNERFERLLVIRPGDTINNRTAWVCKCDCGNHKTVKTESLRSGHTKSCGCLNDEKRSKRAPGMYRGNIKYSPSETTARKIWRSSYKDGLSFKEFYKISQDNCYYCGSEPSNISNAAKSDQKSSVYAKKNGNFTYNGLDRIDSSGSHNIDNIVPCCKYCNYAKRERTLEEFKKWIHLVYNNLFSI